MNENNSWTGEHILLSRKILNVDQKQLALMLGWTGKQNVSDLERGYKNKRPTTQTELSIECLLRRSGLWDKFLKEKAKL